MEIHVELGYEAVADVLRRALDQTQSGKGKERHASDEPFEHQEIMDGARRCGPGAMAFQVRKKALEAVRLADNGEYERAKTDILGAIVYAAAEYLRVEEMRAEGVFGEACEVVALDDERCEDVKEDVDRPFLRDLVDWSQAPEWAKWAVQSSNGPIYFVEESDHLYTACGRGVLYRAHAPLAHDWAEPLRRPKKTCHPCSGTGWTYDTHLHAGNCVECNGTGQVNAE